MKTYLIAGIFFILGLGTTAGIAKFVIPKPAPCPECPECKLSCPPATEVNLQTLDMEGLKRIKGDFVYSPALSNVVIRIEAKDSLLIKELLKKVK